MRRIPRFAFRSFAPAGLFAPFLFFAELIVTALIHFAVCTLTRRRFLITPYVRSFGALYIFSYTSFATVTLRYLRERSRC